MVGKAEESRFHAVGKDDEHYGHHGIYECDYAVFGLGKSNGI